MFFASNKYSTVYLCTILIIIVLSHTIQLFHKVGDQLYNSLD
jgi:hypothetical protein